MTCRCAIRRRAPENSNTYGHLLYIIFEVRQALPTETAAPLGQIVFVMGPLTIVKGSTELGGE